MYTAPYIYIPGLPLQCTLPFLSMPCQLRFDAVLMFLRINLITNWGKFCTCSSNSTGSVLINDGTLGAGIKELEPGAAALIAMASSLSFGLVLVSIM